MSLVAKQSANVSLQGLTVTALPIWGLALTGLVACVFQMLGVDLDEAIARL